MTIPNKHYVKSTQRDYTLGFKYRLWIPLKMEKWII
ncbi:hypothetical protein EDB37_101096 [Vibrio crassostreae]|nr:hypothetical protein EDB37_101096 [Vibrio crassostreae]